MKAISTNLIVAAFLLVTLLFTLSQCNRINNETLNELKKIGLVGNEISAEQFFKGVAPKNFKKISGAEYKPSYNEDPGIPAQCWIETSYGTQNACKYCHTDYLSSISHGNGYPIGEDQITYSFPTANLNRILWQNVIYPEKLEQRLKKEAIAVPNLDDIEYVRVDNWLPMYSKVRENSSNEWLNTKTKDKGFILFPALNPNHLFPFNQSNPTDNGTHGYIDNEGFVRCERNEYTGWRAVNFFPYAIFTPLTGSVSGIYLRLPKVFTTENGVFSTEIYKANLSILEKNIKNQAVSHNFYVGDASRIEINKGFYPIGTEFAHPLHYVDLSADGQVGIDIDGVVANSLRQFEFPGTRSKRVKEIRYMYKWKEVSISDISLEEAEHDGESTEFEFEKFIGNEGQGWVDNGSGWIISAYIENRYGELRPQTTEELAQCVGCHGKVGNTVDAIWSFQRKLPEMEGWADMNYGKYNSKTPNQTKLNDYQNAPTGMGELGYFFYSVVGADLYGVMPTEISNELYNYAKTNNLETKLMLKYPLSEILNDEILKNMSKDNRLPRLLERQKLMRHYSENKAYLYKNNVDNSLYIKGNVFYPSVETMKANIRGYRKVVLDQSFNLGKDLFGSIAENVPFTFRSDGTVKDEYNKLIEVGNVIYSRPYSNKGVGITPTGIIVGNAIDVKGNYVENYSNDDVLSGKVKFTGTLDLMYNPILSGIVVK
jgi:hypothetical protein